MEPRVLTSHEVASLMQVSPSAVLRWIDQGMLRAFRTPGGHRRVGTAELLEFLRAQRMPVPRALEAPRLRLLVIDDEPGFLRSLGESLRRADPRLDVELAESAVDGLIKIGLKRPDVVLLDAYMPGLEGPETCRRIKSEPQTAHIAVLAMSGRRSDELIARFEKAGAAAFLPKPLKTTAIIEQLQLLGLLARENAPGP
ncbi:MAG: response regulator [Myxococcales bacterium]|nr:response regulator [Myxococcales bacterium]